MLKRRWLLVALLSALICLSGCRPTDDVIVVDQPSLPADPGPVIAQVGAFSLYRAQVPEFARMARTIRGAAGIAMDDGFSPESERSLAIEVLVLAGAAGTGLDGIDAEGKDEYQRVLARRLLERVVAPVGDDPISDEEMQHAHHAEIEQYQKTGESDLYKPTRIDAMLVVIGLFPDAHQPLPDEVPILSRPEALALARRYKDACGDRVWDLDRFLGRARDFTAGRPTVSVQSLPGVALDRRLASVDARIHTALVALDGNGAISEPVEFDGGASVIRRGYTSPGKGENPDQIRPQLEAKVRDRRRQEAFQRLLVSLIERYQVQTWPERLTDKRRGQSQP